MARDGLVTLRNYSFTHSHSVMAEFTTEGHSRFVF